MQKIPQVDRLASPMYFFFADDARQIHPTRDRMQALVGIGGFSVQADKLRPLEIALETICTDAGFPSGEEFKWSPPKNRWMRENLVGETRLKFFLRVVETLAAHQVVMTLVASDTDCATATDAGSHELDVTQMYLERAHIQLKHAGTEGIVIVDRPGGGSRDEQKFLISCVEFVEKGSNYVRPDRFAVNVLCGSSSLIRCLQAADLVASCGLARIGGETNFSPPVFDAMKPLLHKNRWGYRGGSGLKLHPDGKFRNLYYWLLGEKEYVRGNTGTTIPAPELPYKDDDGTPKKGA